jgi:hypothetical protein
MTKTIKEDPNAETIDLDELFVQKREVHRLQQDSSLPWGPSRYDPTKYLGRSERCPEHE